MNKTASNNNLGDDKSINFHIENNSNNDVSFTYSYSVASKNRYSIDPERLNKKYPDILNLENSNPSKGRNSDLRMSRHQGQIDLDEKIAYLRSYLARKKAENKVSNILYLEDIRLGHDRTLRSES